MSVSLEIARELRLKDRRCSLLETRSPAHPPPLFLLSWL